MSGIPTGPRLPGSRISPSVFKASDLEFLAINVSGLKDERSQIFHTLATILLRGYFQNFYLSGTPVFVQLDLQRRFMSVYCSGSHFPS